MNNTNLSNDAESLIKPKKGFTPIRISLIIISLTIIIFAIIFLKNYKLVKSYDTKVYPGVYVLNKDLSALSSEDLNNELNSLSSELINKTIKSSTSDKEFLLNYSDLEYKLNINELATEIISYGKDHTFLTKLKLIKKPTNKEFKFSFTYNEEELDTFVNEVYEDLYVSPVNSTIDIYYNSITIAPDISGLEVNKENLKENIITALNDIKIGSEVNIPIETNIVNPKITADALSKVNKKLSSFSTNFIYGESGTNLQVGAANIDNNIIMPGETYSTDKAIGRTTLERGFVYANTYLDGKVVKGLGGGVCQVSSTLYNALLTAGIIPTERLNHMMPVGYIGIGLDATLADDLIDLKFVNDTEYPMVINSTAANGVLTVEIWSNEANDDGITYQTYRDIHSELSVDTYLHGYDANGNLVFNQYLNTSNYAPLPTN